MKMKFILVERRSAYYTVPDIIYEMFGVQYIPLSFSSDYSWALYSIRNSSEHLKLFDSTNCIAVNFFVKILQNW